MFSFLHNYVPETIAFRLGSWPVHWYGILMVLGGLLGLGVVIRLADKYQIKRSVVYDLAFYFALGAVIGARLYFVAYSWSFIDYGFWDIFKIWQGGMAVHGVMLGGFTASYLYCRVKKLNIFKIFDLTVVALAIGQVIGRWGNYFNQEIFGKPTDLPWGIPIEPFKRPLQYLNQEYFHPTVLYESLGSLLIFALLLVLHKYKLRSAKIPNGMIFGVYLILYSVMRFGLEFLRLDQSPEIFGFRWAMIFSGFLILAGIYLISWVFIDLKISSKQSQDYT